MMSRSVARTEHIMLHHYTNHEGQRTGVNVGMVDTAVLPICIFPAGRALMLLTEFLRSSSIASQTAERETFIFIPHSPKLQQAHKVLFFILHGKISSKNICTEINTVTLFLFFFFCFWLKQSLSNEDCCQPDHRLLPCDRNISQILFWKQVPASTSLPRLTSWPNGITWHTTSGTEEDTITFLPLSEIRVPGYFHSQCFPLYIFICACDSHISFSSNLCSTTQTAKENNDIGQ